MEASVPMLDDELDPYAVLQVSPTAEHEVVRSAYRALARLYHPDVSTSEEARRRMVAINRAWEILGDPTSRAEVDARLAVGQNRQPGSPSTATWNGSSASPAGAGDGSHAPGGGWTRGQEPVSPWMSRHTQPPTRGWGAGAAGPPPGRPSGSVLDFGVYLGWSLGEIARVDPGYLDWLAERPEGRPYCGELHALRARRPATRTTSRPTPGRRRTIFGLG